MRVCLFPSAQTSEPVWQKLNSARCHVRCVCVNVSVEVTLKKLWTNFDNTLNTGLPMGVATIITLIILIVPPAVIYCAHSCDYFDCAHCCQHCRKHGDHDQSQLIYNLLYLGYIPS